MAAAVLIGFLTGATVWPAMAQGNDTPLLDGLGDHHHAITTSVPAAQDYFDQGLRLYYAFNFDEAAKSFRTATELDPECAMCYWGIALVLGPNINAPMDPRRGRDAHAAIETAAQLAPRVSAKEQAYVRAMAARYAADPFAPREELDQAHAHRTGEVAARYPDDPDAAVLHAAALMMLSPWDYWTPEKRPRQHTETILSRLSGAMRRAPDHAGACHYFIHAVEAAYPDRAVPCAEKLPTLMPGAGHVVHMPAHIYIRVGRYDDAIDRNIHAVHADEAYIAENHPAGEYPLAYYPHNYHFLAFAASMAGNATTALDAAWQVSEHTEQTLLTDPDLGGTLQHFITTPLSTLVRFGRWQDVLEQQPFDDGLTYPRGHWHFARGMAFVGLGRLDEAESELRRLQALVNHPSTAAVVIFGINTGPEVLSIAEAVLAGHLAAERGQLPKALAHLSRGVELEDALTYNEPPDWNLPVRQVLAQTLRDAGQLEEAEAAYVADLVKYPGNRWSVDGLADVRQRRTR